MKYLLLGTLFIFPLIVISKPVNQLENHKQLDQQQLIENLLDPDPNVQKKASETLQKIKTDDPFIQQALVDLLSNRMLSVKLEAVKILQIIQPMNPAIQATLIQILLDPHTKETVIQFLKETKIMNSVILQQLVDLLSDPNLNTRSKAATALISIKPTDIKIYQKLVEALLHPKQHTRKLAALVLAKIKPPPEIKKQLVNLLSFDSKNKRYIIHFRQHVQKLAARILIEIKPTDYNTLRQLIEILLFNPQLHVRRMAAQIIAETQLMDDPEALRQVMKHLQFDPRKIYPDRFRQHIQKTTAQPITKAQLINPKINVKKRKQSNSKIKSCKKPFQPK